MGAMCCTGLGSGRQLQLVTLGEPAMTGWRCRNSGLLNVHRTAPDLPLAHTLLGNKQKSNQSKPIKLQARVQSRGSFRRPTGLLLHKAGAREGVEAASWHLA